MLAAAAQMEADLARARALDGLAAAHVALARGQSRAAIARALGVSRVTLYRHLDDGMR